MKKKYVMGLDVGISSVGWGLLELNEQGCPIKVMDTGVRIFTPGENVKNGESKAKNRREKRGSRRIIRRREYRVDRIKYLLNHNGYLGSKTTDDKISDSYEKLTVMFEKTINNYYKSNNKTPYELKVEALSRKLSSDELCIILVHYAKHRGYKSNRDEIDDKETGKLKSAIADNEKVMKTGKYRTVSEMFINDSRFSDKIRNSSGDYKMTVTRAMYYDEINKVLDKQIELGLIDDDFKQSYLNIWGSQRHYAKGPGGDSKYGGNLIERMIGKCKFTNEPRAPKCAPSVEIFIALSNLVNFRYKDDTSEYKKLTNEQIKKFIELAKKQDKLTYAKVCKELGFDTIQIKGLNLSSKQYGTFINKFKDKVLGIPKDKRLDVSKLTDAEREQYQNDLNKEMLSQTFIELKTYTKFRKLFVQRMGNDEWSKISNDYDFLDNIAVILTNYKTNDDVIEHLKENGVDEKYYDVILELPNFKDHIMLSLSLVKKLIPLLLEGYRYDEAMDKLGYNFSDLSSDKEKHDLLIPMNQDNEIRNQRVLRSLAQTRKVINSIIKKYGMPEQINVETARELAKTMSERKEITKRMEANKAENDKIKADIVFLFPNKFNSIDDVNSMDLLKYKLWKEQNGKCGYSMETIPFEILYDNNLVQIDHILPYSRTFNDNYLNKTLVFSKCNQEKGNKTPYEWFGNTEKWDSYKKFINGLNIRSAKKDNYLLTALTNEIENEMRDQNLNDTKYISRYLANYLKQYLNVNKVATVNGSITGRLRAIWGLNGLTHSLESKDYYLGTGKKNRDNHLHHAMDALVIASVTPSLIKQVTDYEKYSRYINGKTDAQLVSIAKSITGIYPDDADDIKKLLKEGYIQKRQNGKNILMFPTPYEEFINELKVRVYEQNRDVMINELRKIEYTSEELSEVNPIIPSFAKSKISGSLHGETYYGIRKNGDEIETTERVSVASSRFKKALLDKMVDAKAGSKDVYLTLLNWLDNDEKITGEVAFKNKGYPINPKTGNMIKKVKIGKEYKNMGHVINNKVVAKESIYVIDVYAKEDSDKLYFVGLDQLDWLNKKRGVDFSVTIWWGRDKNSRMINFKDLENEYTKIISLRKDDLVKVVKRDGTSGLGYVNGFSGGRLEIKSCLGDGNDLIGDGRLFKKQLSQYMIDVPTIKSIEKIKLSTLGKIE